MVWRGAVRVDVPTSCQGFVEQTVPPALASVPFLYSSGPATTVWGEVFHAFVKPLGRLSARGGSKGRVFAYT